MANLPTVFYRQNEWATLRILEVCRGLDDEHLGATAVGTYGSIRDTLRHLVASEAGYACRLGDDTIRRLAPDEPWPGFDALAEMVSAHTAVFVGAARGGTNRIIRLDPDTEPYDSEAAVILVQAFNHATEHRSQICTILTTLGIEPPDLSGWEWGLADGRMRRV
ncbi:MAG TPA: DinB family protein [Acidimicrobiia bacterium]|nr:DinB family protein [Acidimicrobiia bacterium]